MSEGSAFNIPEAILDAYDAGCRSVADGLDGDPPSEEAHRAGLAAVLHAATMRTLPTNEGEERFSSKVVACKGEHGTREWVVPCDDGAGGELHVFQAFDGDLHFSMRYNQSHPNADDLSGLDEAHRAMARNFVSVRLRTGIGGGSNPQLHVDLVKALTKAAQ